MNTFDEGWSPEIQCMRQQLESLVESVRAYRQSIVASDEKLGAQPDNQKLSAVIHWQIDLADELLETLETDVIEEVIRLAEQDVIISSSDVDDILI